MPYPPPTEYEAPIQLLLLTARENSTKSADLELGHGSGWPSTGVVQLVSDLKVIWGESTIGDSRSSFGLAGQHRPPITVSLEVFSRSWPRGEDGLQGPLSWSQQDRRTDIHYNKSLSDLDNLASLWSTAIRWFHSASFALACFYT